MSTPAQRKMTVDEFLAWAEGQDGRWELYNGVPYPMGPERVRHGEVKFAVQSALVQGIRKADLPCHMQPNGVAVRVSRRAAHVPDSLVYCGPKLPNDSIEVPDPIIVVEVASPSTRKIDASLKLSGYFSLPSVQHYLIVDPDDRPWCTTAARVTARS
jgi:Uma2 family endonuclease